jgi:hypothetical protein
VTTKSYLRVNEDLQAYQLVDGEVYGKQPTKWGHVEKQGTQEKQIQRISA